MSPTSGIGIYDYTALLADSGTEIINGSWVGLVLSDDWSATLQGVPSVPPVPSTPSTPAAVPVPAAVWLFGSGLIGIIGTRKKASKLT